MLKQSFLALSAEAKAKANAKPNAKPDAFAPTSPLAPLVSKADLKAAPKAPPTPKTAPGSAHHAAEDKVTPAPKTPERRAQPAYGARGGVPNNPQIDHVSHTSLMHGISVGLGTALEGIKSIPGTLTTPFAIHADSSGNVSSSAHPAVMDVKPTTFDKALGAPAEPTGYVDLLNGGRTKTPYDVQAKTLSAVDPSKLGPKRARVLAMGIANLPTLERTNVLAGIPHINNFHLFGGDAGTRKKFLDLQGMPENASDKQIIDALGKINDKKPKGWNKLNPFRDGFNPGTVLGNVGESYIHPAFRDFVETPAKLGAGVAGASFAVGETGHKLIMGEKHPFGPVREALAEATQGGKGAAGGIRDMIAHPDRAFQDDPIGSALALVTLGDTAAGKIASSRTLRGAEADKWVNQERILHGTDLTKAAAEGRTPRPVEVSKGPKSKKPLTRWLQDHMDANGFGLDKAMAKNVNSDHTGAVGHNAHAVGVLFDAMHNAARTGRISLARQTEILHTHGEGVTHAQMRDFYQGQHDNITSTLVQDTGLRADKQAQAAGEMDKPQGAAELHTLADHYDTQASAAAHKAELAQTKLTTGVKSKTSRAKLAKDAMAAEADAKRWQSLADKTRADAETAAPSQARLLTKNQRRNLERVQKNLKGHVDWHTKPETALTSPEAHWLDTARNVAQYRTKLVKDNSGLTDESLMFRDMETPINVAAHDPAHPLHEVANQILTGREDLRSLFRKYPGLGRGKGVVPEEITAQAEAVTQQLSDNLHGFSDAGHGNAFRVPRDRPSTASPFRLPGRKAAPRDDFGAMAGDLKGTTSAQLRTGNFVPSVDPLLQGAARASRAAASVDFLDRLINSGEHGIVRVPTPKPGTEVRIGDIVTNPEAFVLRDAGNLRRNIESRSNTDTALGDINDASAAKAVEEAYHTSLTKGGDTLTADSYVPSDAGNYVLVPKAVDNSLKSVFRTKDAPDFFNKLYRFNVLYSRPGFAFRNLVQNVATNTLEHVGPVSYYRGLKNDLPVGPGIENRGLAAQAERGNFTETHSIFNILGRADKLFGKGYLPNPLQVGKATAQGHVRVIFDTVAHLNREFENVTRRAVYHKLAVDQARHDMGSSTAGFTGVSERINAKMHGVNDELRGLLEQFADPQLMHDPVKARIAEKKFRAIADRVHAVQGDYVHMPDAPRLAAFVPFYRWYLFIGNLMVKMPFTHPVENQIIQGLGNIGANVRASLGQDLNDGQRNDTNIPIPGLTSTLRKATTINTEYVNPFTSLSDVVNHPETLAPLFDQLWSAIKGKDSRGGDLTDQYGNPLSLGGNLASGATQALNTFAPLKVVDSIMHPGAHSANSIPFINEHPRYQSAAKQLEQSSPFFKTPGDTTIEQLLNYVTSAGIHEKNLTGEESSNVTRAEGNYSKEQTRKQKVKLAQESAAVKARLAKEKKK